jgi:hypothetical protein
MRSILDAVRQKLYASSSGYVLPILLEITHGVDGFDNPLRIVNNTENLTYGGHEYTAFPFRYDPPDVKSGGEITNARLTICAVDQQIAMILRSTQVVPTVTAVATYWNDETGSTVFQDMATWEFELRNVQGDKEIITGELIYESRLDYEYPVLEFSPEIFPGLF